MSEIPMNRRNLYGEDEAIRLLEALYNELTKYWLDMKLHRDIGYVQHAEAIMVDVEGATSYTSDGVRSWPLGRRSGISSRATSSTQVRFDLSHICPV